MIQTKVDEVADQIMKFLMDYSQDVTDGIKAAVDIVADEVMAEVKAHVTFEEPTGKYVKAFRIKTIADTRFNKEKVWHVTGGEYRLTHLLEKGHAIAGGGRTRAYPHIIFGEHLAIKRMDELARKAVEDANQR